jgi:peptidoglycan-associated lipoprotein
MMVLAGGLAALAVGCAATPIADDADAALRAFNKSNDESIKGRGDTSISIDPAIASKCDLPIAHFAFDSSEIRMGEAPTLDALAHCFISGPLKGEDLMLVGHADPRGELNYNYALGQARAGGVAAYLGLHGLPEERVITSSLGELEATGTSAAGWARDRRVEVLLANH